MSINYKCSGKNQMDYLWSNLLSMCPNQKVFYTKPYYNLPFKIHISIVIKITSKLHS